MAYPLDTVLGWSIDRARQYPVDELLNGPTRPYVAADAYLGDSSTGTTVTVRLANGPLEDHVVRLKQYANLGPSLFPADPQPSDAAYVFMAYLPLHPEPAFSFASDGVNFVGTDLGVVVADPDGNANTQQPGRWRYRLLRTTDNQDITSGELVIEPAPALPA